LFQKYKLLRTTLQQSAIWKGACFLQITLYASAIFQSLFLLHFSKVQQKVQSNNHTFEKSGKKKSDIKVQVHNCTFAKKYYPRKK